MKICTKCKTEKEFTEFSKYKASKDGYQLWCKLCQNAKRKEAWAAYYIKNKNRLIANQKEKQRLRREIISKMKDKPCVDCGQSYPSCVMDFDHLEDKKFLLGRSGNRNWEKVLKEISKCDIICANCHRIRTFNRGQYERPLKKNE